MQIEVYDKVEKPLTLEPAQEAEFAQFETELTLEDLEARIGYCVTLGLRAQAKTLQEYHTLYTLKKSIPYPWLSKEEEETLRRIFPTPYTTQALSPREEFYGPRRKLGDYNFDLIPLAVLETWSAATRCLSEFEIWTREKLERPDPVLIARHEHHPYLYLLARWGQDALRPLNELAKETGHTARYEFVPFRSPAESSSNAEAIGYGSSTTRAIGSSSSTGPLTTTNGVGHSAKFRGED